MYSKLLKVVGEKGYVSECGNSDFEYLNNIDTQAKVQLVPAAKPKAKKRSHGSDLTNQDIIKCIKLSHKEVLAEIRFMKSSFISNVDHRVGVALPRADRILLKIPLAENLDEFEIFESKLLDSDYKNQMMDELSRFQGNCLQSSLSNMISQLISKTLLKHFCFKGSIGRNRDEIRKRAFKETRCYGVIMGS